MQRQTLKLRRSYSCSRGTKAFLKHQLFTFTVCQCLKVFRFTFIHQVTQVVHFSIVKCLFLSFEIPQLGSEMLSSPLSFTGSVSIQSFEHGMRIDIAAKKTSSHLLDTISVQLASFWTVIPTHKVLFLCLNIHFFPISNFFLKYLQI